MFFQLAKLQLQILLVWFDCGLNVNKQTNKRNKKKTQITSNTSNLIREAILWNTVHKYHTPYQHISTMSGSIIPVFVLLWANITLKMPVIVMYGWIISTLMNKRDIGKAFSSGTILNKEQMGWGILFSEGNCDWVTSSTFANRNTELGTPVIKQK